MNVLCTLLYYFVVAQSTNDMYHSSCRMTDSNTTNVAAFTKGERINVGVRPRVNPFHPSAVQTFRPQSSPFAYFRFDPSEGSPSVCSLLLITS